MESVGAERSLRQQAKSKRFERETLRLRRYAPTLRANGGSAAEVDGDQGGESARADALSSRARRLHRWHGGGAPGRTEHGQLAEQPQQQRTDAEHP